MSHSHLCLAHNGTNSCSRLRPGGPLSAAAAAAAAGNVETYDAVAEWVPPVGTDALEHALWLAAHPLRPGEEQLPQPVIKDADAFSDFMPSRGPDSPLARSHEEVQYEHAEELLAVLEDDATPDQCGATGFMSYAERRRHRQ
eukprot:TRINITY_DN1990_c2_g1_i7.p1 TRINITY_DN1990_c2_g1~~TRINITY_DN1990_c2_g1_i7.p1  ORF type:complete len:142 (+),score=27.54 TRINITY_DN1990_c2_g1_i7:104-529(+)